MGTLPTHLPAVHGIRCSGPSSVPSRWRASSAASKMHSFVHGPSPPTCTAPHHEPTALLWPLQSAATDHLPKTLSPVGHRRVTARPNGSAVYAMVEGRGGSSDTSSRIRALAVGSRYGAVATEQMRMDVVCRSVDATVRHGVEVVQAGWCAVRASTLQHDRPHSLNAGVAAWSA